MVLPTVKLGPPLWTRSGTFALGSGRSRRRRRLPGSRRGCPPCRLEPPLCYRHAVGSIPSDSAAGCPRCGRACRLRRRSRQPGCSITPDPFSRSCGAQPQPRPSTQRCQCSPMTSTTRPYSGVAVLWDGRTRYVEADAADMTPRRARDRRRPRSRRPCSMATACTSKSRTAGAVVIKPTAQAEQHPGGGTAC